MVTFVKTLSYDLRHGRSQQFAYLTRLCLQEIDPPSLQPGQLRLSTPVVFHSPLRRVIECVRREEGVTYEEIAALAEVPFDLGSLVTVSDFEAEGSLAVRRGFLKAFIDDALPTPRRSLIDQTHSIVTACLERRSRHEEVSVVSHSFRLKIIQAYVLTKGRLAHDPSLLGLYLAPATRTFEFGDGFIATDPELEESLAA